MVNQNEATRRQTRVRGPAYTAAFAALLISAGSALAADLPAARPAPVVPVQPTLDWSGFYIGIHASYQFEAASSPVSNAVSGARATLQGAGAGPNGLVGGAHVGYNLQTGSLGALGAPFGFYNGFVGVEGDVDGSHYKGGYTLAPVTDGFQEQIQGSVRGRAGVTVNRLLVFVTGGVAFGQVDDTYINNLTGASDTQNHLRVGYTLGTGFEYALTNTISARAEYRYVDYGTFNDTLVNSAAPLAVRHHESDNRVLGGLTYRFAPEMPTAVVARY